MGLPSHGYPDGWYPWDDKKQELWVREMPKHEYVINLENNPIRTYLSFQ